MESLGYDPGARLYLLGVQFNKTVNVTVGALGSLTIPGGWFVYTGRSVHGWSSRLRRFARNDFSLRWHIDYVVREGNGPDLIVPVGGDPDRECELADRVLELPAIRPIEGFGNSDCGSGCQTHGHGGLEEPEVLIQHLRQSFFTVPGWLRFQEDRADWHPGAEREPVC